MQNGLFAPLRHLKTCSTIRLPPQKLKKSHANLTKTPKKANTLGESGWLVVV